MEITAFASSSRGNCYRVTDGKTTLLLEAGLPIKEVKRHLNFKLNDIQGCLISHEHMDHAKAVKDMVKAGIECYMSEGTRDALGIGGHRINAVYPKEQFTLDSFVIMPFEAQHDAAEPLGFLIVSKETGEKLIFATDTYYVKYTFSGLTHIMVECNYSLDILQQNLDAGLIPKGLKDRLLQSHFSLDHVKDFLKANDLSKVQEIWLLHLSEGNSDAERFKREIQELTGKVTIVADV